MACRLSFIYEPALRAFSRDVLRNSGAVMSSCAFCTSTRNSSTSLFRLKTNQNLLAVKNSGASLVQICEKTNWRNSSKNKKSTEYESGSDSDDEDFLTKERAKTEGVRVVQIVLDNLRVDGVLKHAFGIARNKIEVMFYENKIRINGKKPLKKSASINVGDEVDIIRGESEDNENLIVVSRVEVLRIRPSGDYLAMTIRKQKSMIIENYDKDPWVEKAADKTSEENDNEELA